MNFLRRLYFRESDGEIIHSRMIQGRIVIPSPEQDAQVYPELAGWPTGMDLFEWLAPDAEVEANFNDPSLEPWVDVSGEVPVLRFREVNE